MAGETGLRRAAVVVDETGRVGSKRVDRLDECDRSDRALAALEPDWVDRFRILESDQITASGTHALKRGTADGAWAIDIARFGHYL